MKNAEYWIWLQNSLGTGACIDDIVSYFGSVKNLYEADDRTLRESGLFGFSLFETHPQKIVNMRNTSIMLGSEIISYCEKHSIGILTPDDEEYPLSLKAIKDYPAVIYYRGDISCLSDEKIFAVIGTRNPSDYGRKACKKITAQLVQNDSVIVSGGALGVDSVAHKTTIENNGKTILVMGAGLDSNYLKSANEIRRQVEEHGVVISEYAPLVGATQYTFPKRNRIVVALSRGIVVVEAGEKSGTLNTCAHAKKQFKPVFVLPGDMDSVLYAGSRKLSAEGAVTVYKADDILNYFGMDIKTPAESKTSGDIPFNGIETYTEIQGEKNGVSRTERLSKKSSEKKNKTTKKAENIEVEVQPIINEINITLPDTLSSDAVSVFEKMKEGKLTFDDISRSLDLPTFKLMMAMTELEMEGIVEKINSVEYRIINI